VVKNKTQWPKKTAKTSSFMETTGILHVFSTKNIMFVYSNYRHTYNPRVYIPQTDLSTSRITFNKEEIFLYKYKTRCLPHTHTIGGPNPPGHNPHWVRTPLSVARPDETPKS